MTDGERWLAPPANDPVSDFQALAGRAFDERVARYLQHVSAPADLAEVLCRVIGQARTDLEPVAKWQAATVPDSYKLGDRLDDDAQEVVVILSHLLMAMAETAHICRVPLLAAMEHARKHYGQMVEGAGLSGH